MFLGQHSWCLDHVVRGTLDEKGANHCVGLDALVQNLPLSVHGQAIPWSDKLHKGGFVVCSWGSTRGAWITLSGAPWTKKEQTTV